MDNFFRNWLENILACYDRIVFLYQPSDELCAELSAFLKKEKRRFLILTNADIETSNFPCNQKKLSEEECDQLLKQYLSYSFADNFIFLTDQQDFPWPSISNYVGAGILTRREMMETLLK